MCEKIYETFKHYLNDRQTETFYIDDIQTEYALTALDLQWC